MTTVAGDLRDKDFCRSLVDDTVINPDSSESYIDSMPDSARIRRELMAMHPVGRLGEPADVAHLAVFLASDESTSVTGQVFVVDGGRTKKLPLPVV